VAGCKRRDIFFWDFKLYEDQRARIMNILSESSKSKYPVAKLPRLEEKRFEQGVCYFIDKIPKCIKTKEVNVQHINSILLVLSKELYSKVVGLPL
jgi:hypothetical protein